MTLSAIRAFARIAPETVAPSLDVIAPYLRGDNGLDEKGESAAVQKAAEIIHACSSALPRPQSASLASRCSPDLEKAALNSRGARADDCSRRLSRGSRFYKVEHRSWKVIVAFGRIVSRLTEKEKARGTSGLSLGLRRKRLGLLD